MSLDLHRRPAGELLPDDLLDLRRVNSQQISTNRRTNMKAVAAKPANMVIDASRERPAEGGGRSRGASALLDVSE